jgi:hypothetical protein
MKKILVTLFGFFILTIFSCSTGSGGINQPVNDFFAAVKARNIENALGLVQNKYDKNALDRIKDYFVGKIINTYKIITDDDPKAKIAQDQGMGVINVDVTFEEGSESFKCILSKKDGAWVITNITNL